MVITPRREFYWPIYIAGYWRLVRTSIFEFTFCKVDFALVVYIIPGLWRLTTPTCSLNGRAGLRSAIAASDLANEVVPGIHAHGNLVCITPNYFLSHYWCPSLFSTQGVEVHVDVLTISDAHGARVSVPHTSCEYTTIPKYSTGLFCFCLGAFLINSMNRQGHEDIEMHCSKSSKDFDKQKNWETSDEWLQRYPT